MNTLKSEQVKTQGQNAIRPPWTNLADFYEKCTACTACVEVCETAILVKGAGGYPEVDFSSGRGECSFCQACVNACEADVFRAVSEMAWTHKASISTSCLTESGIACRSCQDNCEPRAIRFQLQRGGIAKPVLDPTACNGCGACLKSCPVQAIVLTKEESSPLR